MEGQKTLRFHQKYLNLCTKDERRSYWFVTTWGRVFNDIINILGWTIPLNSLPEGVETGMFCIIVFACRDQNLHASVTPTDVYKHNLLFCFWLLRNTFWPICFLSPDYSSFPYNGAKIAEPSAPVHVVSSSLRSMTSIKPVPGLPISSCGRQKQRTSRLLTSFDFYPPFHLLRRWILCRKLSLLYTRHVPSRSLEGNATP